MAVDGQLDFQQAMTDFKAMFPHIEMTIIENVLRHNNGVVDATIDHLLAMSMANADSGRSERSIPPNANVYARQLSCPVATSRSRQTTVPSEVQSASDTISRSQELLQVGPAVGRLIDLDDDLVTSHYHSAEFQQNDLSNGSGTVHRERNGSSSSNRASAHHMTPNVTRNRSANSSNRNAVSEYGQGQVPNSTLPSQLESSAYSNASMPRRSATIAQPPVAYDSDSRTRATHAQARSISMCESERPYRPSSAANVRSASNQANHRPLRSTSNERPVSPVEPSASGISAELLQERLAENQLRRHTLLDRRNGARQVTRAQEPEEANNEQLQILSDEYLAIVLQNEEFIASLRNDEEFMSELRRDALISERDTYTETDTESRRQERADLDVDRMRFERRSEMENSQRSRDSFAASLQPACSTSSTTNRASISMFGSRRTFAPDEQRSANRRSEWRSGSANSDPHAGSYRTMARPSENRSATESTSALASTDGYGRDRVAELDAFPYSRAIPSDETVEMQRQLKNMRGSTRKKFAQLAKKFFSKSGRKKPTDVTQRLYRQMAAMGGEPTFALLDEDEGDTVSLQTRPQATADANVTAYGNGREPDPAQRYKFDLY